MESTEQMLSVVKAVVYCVPIYFEKLWSRLAFSHWVLIGFDVGCGVFFPFLIFSINLLIYFLYVLGLHSSCFDYV